MDAHAAYHEAGHFVAQYRLTPDDGTERVSIVPGEGTLGHHAPASGLEDHFRLRDGVAEYDPAAVEAEIVILYAGAAADLHLDPSREEEVRAGAGSDDAKAAELLRDHLGRNRERDLRQRAADFVAEHWREIEAVAAELLERKTLNGTEAELILDAAAEGMDVKTALEKYRRLADAK